MPVNVSRQALTAVYARYRVLGRWLWRASRRWTVAGLAAATIAGALPCAMMLASGPLIGALPAAIRDGTGSPAGHHAFEALGIFGAASLGYALTQAMLRFVEPAWTARYVVVAEDLLAAASLAPDQIGHLEDPATARRLGAAAEASRENAHLQTVWAVLQVVELRVQGLVSAGLLLALHWWVPFVLIAGWLVVNWAFNRWRDTAVGELLATTGTHRRRAEYLRQLVMGPAAAKELRIFGLTNWIVSRYGEMWLAAMRPVWRNRRRSTGPLLIGAAALAVSNGLAFGVLAYDAYHGTVSTGRLVVFVQTILATSLLGILGDIVWWVTRSARTAEHVQALVDELGTAEYADRPEPAGVTTGPAEVRLSDVHFGYPSRETAVLDGVDLHIPAGQSIAIVGENGAGKSTLVKLLTGLYEPGRGRISVDGSPVGTAAQRRRVAVIFQQFVHYQLPLRDNVAFGNLAALRDDTAVTKALRDAGGESLVDRGLDTVLSSAFEGGTDLSGGQWQRVALARALAAVEGGAGLLILDEPTAALDIRAEADLFDRFLEVTQGVTTILVSHRLSSVRHADRIVVLAGGRVVEDGTHAELMAACGRYEYMFSLQARRFAESDHA